MNTRLLIAAILVLCGGPARAACIDVREPTTPTDGFVDNRDGTVTQVITGLTWDRCAYGQTYDATTGHCAGSALVLEWEDALRLPAQANDDLYLGRADWRMPNVKELGFSLERACAEPAVNATIFPDTPSIHFWSNTPQTTDPQGRDAALKYINLKDGLGFDPGFAGAAAVRLVRDRNAD